MCFYRKKEKILECDDDILRVEAEIIELNENNNYRLYSAKYKKYFEMKYTIKEWV